MINNYSLEYVMTDEELNNEIRRIIQSPDNYQEFADLLSDDANWRGMNQSIKVPSHVGVGGGDCPECFDYIKVIFDKFSTTNHELPHNCPFCKDELKIKVEFTEDTSEIYIEEV